MQSVSATYTSIMTGASPHWFESKLVIESDTTLTFGEDKLYGMTTSLALWSEKPGIGSCPSGELNVSIAYNNENIIRMAKCIPYVRVTNGTLTSEWIKKGEYFIDERSMTKYDSGVNVLNIHGYDAMLKAEADYPSSTLQWPADDIDVITEIATTIGVNVDSRISNDITLAYQISLPTGYSMRETLSFIAAMYGGNFVISDLGELRFVPYDGSSTTVNLSKNVTKVEYAPALPAYTEVIFTIDENTQVSSGTDTGSVMESYCPIATQSAANNALLALTKVYQPMTATGALLDPATEIADFANVNGVSAILASIETTFGRLMTADISAPLTQEVTHEYQYSSPTERMYKRELGSMSSSITQNSQQIQLKVSSDQIISTINQSAEAVTINANKINLIGSVSVGSNANQAIITVKYGDYEVRITPGGIWMADSNSGKFAHLDPDYLALGVADDPSIDPFSGFAPHFEMLEYWRITDTSGWNVHANSISGTTLFTAQPGTEWEYLGLDPNDSAVAMIYVNGVRNKCYIAKNSGEVVYRLRPSNQ